MPDGASSTKRAPPARVGVVGAFANPTKGGRQMRLGKVLLAVTAAVVLLGALVGTASARNLSISSQFMRALFRAVTFEGAFGRIVCEIQIEGSFHNRTVVKRVGSLVGYVTAVQLLSCATGTATVLRETLPWHVRYLGFIGTLPNITSITAAIIGGSLQVREPFLTCLARGTEARPAIAQLNRDVATRVISSAQIAGSIPTGCQGQEGTFTSERASVFVLNTTTRLTLTLI